MSNGGGWARLAAGGRLGRISRGTAEGGTPNTFLNRRRPTGGATGRMLADAAALRHVQTYGQVAPPGVEASVPSPLAHTRNIPAASLTYV